MYYYEVLCYHPGNIPQETLDEWLRDFKQKGLQGEQTVSTCK